MFVLITSCKNKEEHRGALRDTWLKDCPYPHLFIVGGVEKQYVEGDILYVTAEDDYKHVPHKQFEAIQYAAKQDPDFIFICDDDCYVQFDRLMDSDYHLHDYFGCGPVRMWDKPYYLTGGPGIMLSKKAINAILEHGAEHVEDQIYTSVANCYTTSEDMYWGDRFIGIIMDKVGIPMYCEKRMIDVSLSPLSDEPKQWNDMISYHVGSVPTGWWYGATYEKLTPDRIRSIYDHFQVKLPPIRVGFIVDQWSMGGAEKEFADMILDADPEKIQYVGIVVRSGWEFRVNPLYKDKMPPFYGCNILYEYIIDQDLIYHDSFEEAINMVASQSDVLIKWHTNNPYLEQINKPQILISNATSWYTESNYKPLHADKYIGNSEWSAKWFPKQADNIDVIYSGHEPATVEPTVGREAFREELGIKPTDKIVSHIGRVNLDKNLPTLVDAMTHLPDDWKVMFVGKITTVQTEKFYELVDSKIPGRYITVPWVDHVGDAYAASDVFVLASFYEGFSNALAESWMSKTPAVFSDCGSVNELMRDYGNIGTLVPSNVRGKELAAAIEVAMDNEEGTENAYNMIKTITKDKSARKWERAITEVCFNRKKIKVGMLMPNLSFGGQETWCENFARCFSKGQVEVTFFKGIGCHIKTDSECVKHMSQYMDIHIHFDEGVSEELEIDNVFYHDTTNSMMQAMKDMDIIITWGIPELKEYTDGLDIPIVLLSKCMDKWNQELLEKTAYAATDFVQISEDSNIFPENVRRSSVKIYNPVRPDFSPEYAKKTKAETRKEWGAKEDDILIGFVGRWDYQKNPLALARAIEVLPENYKAVYIGTDWRFEEWCDDESYNSLCEWNIKKVLPTYKEELEKILTPDRYILVPPQRHIIDSYNALDAVIVPSRNEGFGITIVETWMMKKPLIACDLGIYKEFGRDRHMYGVTIGPNDNGKKIAEAIKKALAMDEYELEEIRRKAFHECNMSRFMNTWLHFMQLCMGRHSMRKEKPVEINYSRIISNLFEEHKTAKRVARKLNIMRVPLPEGEGKEWTYLNVVKYRQIDLFLRGTK